MINIHPAVKETSPSYLHAPFCAGLDAIDDDHSVIYAAMIAQLTKHLIYLGMEPAALFPTSPSLARYRAFSEGPTVQGNPGERVIEKVFLAATHNLPNPLLQFLAITPSSSGTQIVSMNFLRISHQDLSTGTPRHPRLSYARFERARNNGGILEVRERIFADFAYGRVAGTSSLPLTYIAENGLHLHGRAFGSQEQLANKLIRLITNPTGFIDLLAIFDPYQWRYANAQPSSLERMDIGKMQINIALRQLLDLEGSIRPDGLDQSKASEILSQLVIGND